MATSKFLIEVPHEDGEVACARAVKAFLNSGSHFVSHADWGCYDGVHKAWIVIEAESKEEARHVVPPLFRAKAKIVKLNAFTMKEIQSILDTHDS